VPAIEGIDHCALVSAAFAIAVFGELRGKLVATQHPCQESPELGQHEARKLYRSRAVIAWSDHGTAAA